METFNETTIDHIGGEPTAGVSTGERFVKSRLIKLALEHPDEVQCVAMNTDGSVYYKVPWKWIQIRPPRQVHMTEEQKRAVAERLNAARSKQQ